MSSLLAELPVVQGSQEPRICSVPRWVSSAGEEAVELAATAGLVLDPWEAFVLTEALGERADGNWAARDVGLNVARQNGKGSILEARALAGLYLLGERLITHSAHQFDTSLEAFRRLLSLIEDTQELSRRVKRVSRSHGEEGIELHSGQRVRFRTRTKGGGRGFTGDCLILDEAMILPESAHGALLPTLSARPNPQVWYTGSAVDKEVHQDGIVFARVRERGIAGEDPRLAYFEWSVDAKSPAAVDEALALDPEAWARANPGLGIRIAAETIESEHRAMASRTFAVERLGVGDWPDTDVAPQVISTDAWLTLVDVASAPEDPVCFAFDATPDRGMAAIAVAGARPDGLAHVEVIRHRAGTGWVVPELVRILGAHRTVGNPICDGAGPAASLVPELEQLGVKVDTLNASEHGRACGLFYDAVDQQGLRHLGTPETLSAIKGAAKRPLGDAWAWSRKSSSVDISPLVACTEALWGFRRQAEMVPLVGVVSR